MKKLFLFVLCFLVCSCSTVGKTGRAIGTVGKVGWGAAKVTGKVAKTAGNVAVKTGEFAYDGTRSVVYMAKGKDIIPLDRRGNAYYAKVVLNGKVSANFLVDTGASSMQISRLMARKLNIKLRTPDLVSVRLAGGYQVQAYKVNLTEVKIGSSRVKNISVLIMTDDNLDVGEGLIGMSLLEHFDFQIDPQAPELILQQKVI